MNDNTRRVMAALYDAITTFQVTANYSSLQHAQMRSYLAEHLAGPVAAQLEQARSIAVKLENETSRLADDNANLRRQLAWATEERDRHRRDLIATAVRYGVQTPNQETCTCGGCAICDYQVRLADELLPKADA